MEKDDEPKYFINGQYRHLLMSMVYFHINQKIIEVLLEQHGFNPAFHVTRIDDHQSNMVEFVQSVDTGELNAGIDPYTQRTRKTPYN